MKILPESFFARPAEIVAPQLIGCRLIKYDEEGGLIDGVIVETEAYSQKEPACHGYRRRTPSNETLFGKPAHFYIYMTYGIYHCVNVVTDRAGWASGVLLRSIAMPGEDERIAAGPGLVARRFGLNKSHDKSLSSFENGLWISSRSSLDNMYKVINTTRIGISQAKELSWRWYLQDSRSISKRAKGDRCPPRAKAWTPSPLSFNQ